MSRSSLLSLPLLACMAILQPAAAQTAPPADVPFDGVIKVDVDATDIGHRIFRVRTTMPAKPGPMTLLYPQWIPGHHSPSGTLEKVAGLTIRSDTGEVIPWTRDQYDVFAFKIDVPEGTREIVAEFQFLSSQGPAQGRVVMTPEMLNLQWNSNSLYPAGYYARNIKAQASVKLPAGWSYATALETERRDGDTVVFKPIDYDDLVDSPLFAGKYYKRVELADGKQPVHLNLFADAAKSLEAKPDQLDKHKALVQQMDKLYGARHFDHYDFLLALTDKLGGIGLEHHRSSENSGATGYFTDWDKTWIGRDLLPHEFNHSWNGKYRRGADLSTPNFNVPMGDSLLWLYEGQTQFYGQVLAARSGLWNQDQTRAVLASVAATYDRGRPGLSWRTVQDTTNDPTIAQRRPLAYRNYQMSEDYYSGGQMVWLEVDGKLRELSGDKRSLDDFAKAFFGMDNGAWDVNPYTFEDIVATLNGIAPFDWSSFLRDRIDGHGPLIGGLASHGWKLVYNDKPNEAFSASEARSKSVNLTYSIGASLDGKGGVIDVLWDGPAFKAGLSPGMSVVAVDGREYSADAVKEAVTAAKDGTAPIELLVKNFDRYQTLRVDYHGGLQYPHLERIAGTPDRLAELLKAR
ncbi:M61 family metallopeptidase [Xanthomonas massiliensis]|uniref:M61 family metallopeptidase n=1 Tax=Xanthomonas massiliensis TaxID=1720302 RepID=UPI00082620AE|nr:M61 family metallopeptidase [Xanthomonas massiliensis]